MESGRNAFESNIVIDGRSSLTRTSKTLPDCLSNFDKRCDFEKINVNIF